MGRLFYRRGSRKASLKRTWKQSLWREKGAKHVKIEGRDFQAERTGSAKALRWLCVLQSAWPILNKGVAHDESKVLAAVSCGTLQSGNPFGFCSECDRKSLVGFMAAWSHYKRDQPLGTLLGREEEQEDKMDGSSQGPEQHWHMQVAVARETWRFLTWWELEPQDAGGVQWGEGSTWLPSKHSFKGPGYISYSLVASLLPSVVCHWAPNLPVMHPFLLGGQAGCQGLWLWAPGRCEVSPSSWEKGHLVETAF
jgi:hypothetical protein